MSPDPGSTSNQRSARVLLVEDNADARQALLRFLEMHGIQVIAVSERDEVTTALNTPERIDAIITDLMLPDIDGREIAEMARQRDPAPLTILVTGWDQALSGDECAAHGIHHLLYKPLDLPALIRLILPAPNTASTDIAGTAIDRTDRNP